MDKDIEKIFIGQKDLSKYLSASFYGLSEGKDKIMLCGRGHNVKKTIDVASILLRQDIEVPDDIPSYSDLLKSLEDGNIKESIEMVKKIMTCEISIGSETYKDTITNKVRNVSTLDVTIRGKKKESE